ncbi:MAG TPA: hypothetical protein VN662_07985 [Rhodanobacteraceae bacterium]|jgi:hypothetical protein|nr:hypothetical protein [Rhodanobacteraceae bacterium]
MSALNPRSQGTHAMESSARTAVPQSMSVRLTGDDAGVGALMAAIRGLEEVDGIVELSLDAPDRPDDSSSAGLSDDTASEFREMRVHVPSSVAYDYVHGRIETLAANTGVVVEWLDLE